ncbi:hypothetical protein [Pleionea sp. CnH1-48]|uniref:hypothetical protein n=1 Tax=Pleionea sp. CnH1-48 TaxID=2954494 RepID=UPI002096B1B2|nr:hypothetical protein [Pleionea sp. CnH1-48]MCO7226827.1 hypothetical protein [Pleionea sp. CnH1-48]
MKLCLSKLLLSAVLLGAVVNAKAAYVYSGISNITYLSVYNRSSAPGDIFVKLSNPAEECTAGYYVSADSPGRDTVMSVLLSAYHAKSRIRINAYDSPNWRGSNNDKTCEIEGVNFVDY